MSTSVETSPARTARQDRNHAPANGTTAVTAPVVGTNKIEIAGLEIEVPVKFVAGHVLTENEAQVIDAAYVRQFTNNETAIAKGRAEQLAKAATDADKAKYAPWTADQLVTKYATYAPSIGGSRIGSMEKLRQDAAWRVFLGMVTDHNKSVASGGQGVMKGPAVGKPFAVPTGKGSVEWRENMIRNLQGKDVYKDRIQAQVDLLVAERQTKKSDETKVSTVAISADDLI